MGRYTAMIPINREAFKIHVKKRTSFSSMALELGVTKQAVNGWLSRNRMPPRALSKLAKNLNLTMDEINSITKKEKPEISILYRSDRNVAISEETTQKILNVSEDFFRLNKIFSIENKKAEVRISGKNPAATAEIILKNLDLNSGNLDIRQVINSLKRFNINVLFFDFDNEKAHAVCVQRGDEKGNLHKHKSIH